MDSIANASQDVFLSLSRLAPRLALFLRRFGGLARSPVEGGQGPWESESKTWRSWMVEADSFWNHMSRNLYITIYILIYIMGVG